MKYVVYSIILILLLTIPVSAIEIDPVQPPEDLRDLMPDTTGNFMEDVMYVLRSAFAVMQPRFTEGMRVCLRLICAVVLISVLQSFDGLGKQVAETVGIIAIAAMLLNTTNAMISFGADTIQQISQYAKLLLPVLTAALAAQGGVTASAALYAGTAMFDAVLSTAISVVLIPLVYVFLIFGILSAAFGDDLIARLKDFVKWVLTWCLKIILYVFTGYISITGVVSGAADQATLKATKLTISGMVPVVGGILSDASEAVVVGVSVAKNAAGIYGIVALLAIVIVPFLSIAVQSLLLKLTALVCDTIGNKKTTQLIETFSAAMGFLLAMTGTICLIQLISIVCFMKGMS